MIQQCSRVFMLSFLFLDWTLCTSVQESRRWLAYFPFPVNGGWSEWYSSPCSATCGDGTKHEFRLCTNPPPLNGGRDCEGHRVRDTPCHTQQCPTTTPIPTKCSFDVNCTGFNCPRQQYPFCEPNLDWSACGCTECTNDHHCSCATGMIGHCRDDTFTRKCECKQLPGATCKSDSDCNTHVCTGNLSQSFCHEKKFLVYDFSSCDCRDCSKDSDCHCQSGLIPSCQTTAFGNTCHCNHANATTPIPTKCSSDVNCTGFNCPRQQYPFCEPSIDWSACGCTECTDDHHCSCPTGMIGHCRDDIFTRKCECKQLPVATCKNDSDCNTHVCTGNLSQSYCHEKKFLVYDFSSCDCRECSKDSDCHCQSGLIPNCTTTAFGNTCHCNHANESSMVHTTSTHSTHSTPKRTTSITTTNSPTTTTTISTINTPTQTTTPHGSTTRPTHMTSSEVTKTTTDSTTTLQSTKTTIPENNTSFIMVTLTTKPQGVRKCHICGDSPNSISCDTRAIYMGNLQDCAPGENYCMTDLIHNGQTFPSIYKRCVTEEECRNKWLHQTSDLEHCTNYGNVLVEGHYSCHFCCTSNGCNSLQIPDKSTLYIKA